MVWYVVGEFRAVWNAAAVIDSLGSHVSDRAAVWDSGRRVSRCVVVGRWRLFRYRVIGIVRSVLWYSWCRALEDGFWKLPLRWSLFDRRWTFHGVFRCGTVSAIGVFSWRWVHPRSGGSSYPYLRPRRFGQGWRYRFVIRRESVGVDVESLRSDIDGRRAVRAKPEENCRRSVAGWAMFCSWRDCAVVYRIILILIVLYVVILFLCFLIARILSCFLLKLLSLPSSWVGHWGYIRNLLCL